jgi:hypothetical protein
MASQFLELVAIIFCAVLLVRRILSLGQDARFRKTSSARSWGALRPLILAACLWIVSYTTPTRAGIIIQVDENGKGSFTFTGKQYGAMNGKRVDFTAKDKTIVDPSALDPVANDKKARTLAYTLPAAVKATDGDLVLTTKNEPGSSPLTSDLVRFQGNKLYYYSDYHVVGLKSDPEFITPLADMYGKTTNNNPPFPAFPVQGRATVMRDEGTNDNNNGVLHQPRGTDPGAGADDIIDYKIISEGTGGKDIVDGKSVESTMGKSVHYNAATRRLTFTNDFVTGTGFLDDPLVGASVNAPSYTLLSSGGGNFLFRASPGDQITITNGSETYFQAHLPDLIYNAATNTFEGLLTDFSLDPGSGSIWIADTNNLFDPTFDAFDPKRRIGFSVTPDSNFLDLTQSFTIDGNSTGTNLFTPFLIPEPSTFVLGSMGLLAMAVWRRRRLRDTAQEK